MIFIRRYSQAFGVCSAPSTTNPSSPTTLAIATSPDTSVASLAASQSKSLAWARSWPSSTHEMMTIQSDGIEMVVARKDTAGLTTMSRPSGKSGRLSPGQTARLVRLELQRLVKGSVFSLRFLTAMHLKLCPVSCDVRCLQLPCLILGTHAY